MMEEMDQTPSDTVKTSVRDYIDKKWKTAGRGKEITGSDQR